MNAGDGARRVAAAGLQREPCGTGHEEGPAPSSGPARAALRQPEPTPSALGGGEWSRRLRVRRSASAELDTICARLDGAMTVNLPDTGRCPRWCSAMTRADLEHYADTIGTCPCPAARKAGAA